MCPKNFQNHSTIKLSVKVVFYVTRLYTTADIRQFRLINVAPNGLRTKYARRDQCRGGRGQRLCLTGRERLVAKQLCVAGRCIMDRQLFVAQGLYVSSRTALCGRPAMRGRADVRGQVARRGRIVVRDWTAVRVAAQHGWATVRDQVAHRGRATVRG